MGSAKPRATQAVQTPTDSTKSNGFPIGAIIGIAVGGFLLIIILVVIVVLILTKRRRGKDNNIEMGLTQNMETLKNIEIQSEIGKGAHGAVYLGMSGSTYVAVKKTAGDQKLLILEAQKMAVSFVWKMNAI